MTFYFVFSFSFFSLFSFSFFFYLKKEETGHRVLCVVLPQPAFVAREMYVVECGWSHANRDVSSNLSHKSLSRMHTHSNSQAMQLRKTHIWHDLIVIRLKSTKHYWAKVATLTGFFCLKGPSNNFFSAVTKWYRSIVQTPENTRARHSVASRLEFTINFQSRPEIIPYWELNRPFLRAINPNDHAINPKSTAIS